MNTFTVTALGLLLLNCLPAAPVLAAEQPASSRLQSLAELPQQPIASRNLNIQPTITVRPGAAVRLIVHRDLILAPWRT